MRIRDDIDVSEDALRDFCKKWRVSELALFGSVLREDFGPDSDVDVLVRFDRPVPWTLFDIGHMEDELSAIVGRRVEVADWDAVEKSENWIRRRSILESARHLYAA